MKNREKYREELMNIVKLESTQRSRVSTFCDFVKNNVLPNYTIQMKSVVIFGATRAQSCSLFG